MTKEKQSVSERLKALKQQQEAAKNNKPEIGKEELVDQLTHESNGETDFSEIAQKLQERKEQESKGENEGYQKMTIYIQNDIAKSFNALITKRGQQKEFANIALADFVKKKIKELGIDE